MEGEKEGRRDVSGIRGGYRGNGCVSVSRRVHVYMYACMYVCGSLLDGPPSSVRHRAGVRLRRMYLLDKDAGSEAKRCVAAANKMAVMCDDSGVLS